jgi:hypothetical protein
MLQFQVKLSQISMETDLQHLNFDIWISDCNWRKQNAILKNMEIKVG